LARLSGGHEHFVAPDTRSTQALADLAFVLIDLRGVDMAITEPYRLLDQTCAGSSAQFPGAEPDRGDFRAVTFDELHEWGTRTNRGHYVPLASRCQPGDEGSATIGCV
jgi:hypothetical protein